jgi:hypothetical protein
MIASRRFAGMAVSILAAATLIGIGGAGTASASTVGPGHLCTNYYVSSVNGNNSYYGPGCAYGTSPISFVAEGYPGNTNWYMSNSGYGNIKQANTNLCMELDADAGYTVVKATCGSATYMQWEWYGSEIISEWATTVNEEYMCLTLNDAGNDFDVIPCKGDAAEDFFFT